MADVYPELQERRALIADITQQEEERFRRTLKRGLELLEGNDVWDGTPDAKVLPGQTAFKLYDTYGFPLDLQEVIGADHGFTIDRDGFDLAMQEARTRSQGSKVGESSVKDIYREAADVVPEIRFTGYDRETDRAALSAIITSNGLVQTLKAGDEASLVCDSTCFYGEAGGQVGDRGEIRGGDGAVFEVMDTQKPHGGLIVHEGRLVSGELQVGDEVEQRVDHESRAATRRNHSATHLMHWALREVVGERAMQKGSMVGPERLRFDYAGSAALTAEQIQRIEDLVNAAVLANTPATTEVMSMDDAKARGAMGIFEEKYGDVVRMLQVGPSLELCGGNHVARTGDIGLFKIITESGLAAGVRRMEAVTGHGALQRFRAVDTELMGVSRLLRAPMGMTEEKIERLYETQKELGREIDALKKKLIGGGSGDLTKESKSYEGLNALGAVVDLGDASALRELADSLRDKLSPAVIMLGSEAKGGKALLVCAVSKELMGEYRAGDFVKDAARLVGGGGGGRPDFAQAGGADPSGLPAAVARVYEIIEARLATSD
jgi:alanyl-tRNA synthetase